MPAAQPPQPQFFRPHFSARPFWVWSEVEHGSVVSASSPDGLRPPSLHGLSQVTKYIHHEHPHPLPLVRVKALIERLPCISELFQASAALGQGISSRMQEGDRIDRKRLMIEPLFRIVEPRSRICALARIASSTAGQYFCCSGVSCSAPLTILIRSLVNVVQSVLLRPGGEDCC